MKWKRVTKKWIGRGMKLVRRWREEAQCTTQTYKVPQLTTMQIYCHTNFTGIKPTYTQECL